MIDVTRHSTQAMYSTVRIDALKRNGKTSLGTAFYFTLPSTVGPGHVAYLVTNKHVIKDTVSARLLVHEGADGTNKVPTGVVGEVTAEDGFEEAWILHPDPNVDICFLPFTGVFNVAEKKGRHVFFRAFGPKFIPSHEALEKLAAIEDVTMIGYPSGLWDSKHNMPIPRRGTTASHPATPFEGEQFGLADIASFQGSSGSPLLILDEGSYHEGGALVMSSRTLFLGVMCRLAQYPTKGTGKVVAVDIPTDVEVDVRTLIPMHLAIYVRAQTILDVVPMLQEQHEKHYPGIKHIGFFYKSLTT